MMKCAQKLQEENLIQEKELAKEKLVLEVLEKKYSELTEQSKLLFEQAKSIEGLIDFIENKRNTISYCDSEISNLLEQAYRDGKKEIYLGGFWIWITPYGRKIFYKIAPDGNIYADGTVSYSKQGDSYDLDIFINYLKQHCYNVIVHDSPQSYKHYGCGYIPAITFTISSDPLCEEKK